MLDIKNTITFLMFNVYADLKGGIKELSRPGFSKTLVLV